MPPVLIRRQCNNPKCRKWYDVPAWRVRQGRSLYCNRLCGWNAQAKFKWFVCLQCAASFRRPRSVYRKQACKFCSWWCYTKFRLRVKLDEDWRTTPFEERDWFPMKPE